MHSTPAGRLDAHHIAFCWCCRTAQGSCAMKIKRSSLSAKSQSCSHAQEKLNPEFRRLPVARRGTEVRKWPTKGSTQQNSPAMCQDPRDNYHISPTFPVRNIREAQQPDAAVQTARTHRWLHL